MIKVRFRVWNRVKVRVRPRVGVKVRVRIRIMNNKPYVLFGITNCTGKEEGRERRMV